MHKPPYAGCLGYQKMITTLIKQLFWPKVEVYLIDYLSKNLECRQVKVEYRHPIGLLQTFPIPELKWEVISLDFIMELIPGRGIPNSQSTKEGNLLTMM